jgi:F0F1-type ATP synthase assembly protein I
MDTENKELESLSERISAAEKMPEIELAEPSAGRNIGVDFVGSVIICGVVGALADRAFGTEPWCLLGMVVFGFIIGIYSAWRAIQKPER